MPKINNVVKATRIYRRRRTGTIFAWDDKGRYNCYSIQDGRIVGSPGYPLAPASQNRPRPGSKGSVKTNLVNRMMKNHLTQLPFLARTTRAAGVGNAPPPNGPSRLSGVAARTGGFLPLTRPSAAYA